MKQNTSAQPHDWKEARRLRAWELFQQGWTQRDIAGAFGVTSGAVSQWIKRGRAGGSAALRHRSPPGPPAKLSPAQRAHLLTLLAQGAPTFGFRGDLWTAPRVAALIRQEFGVAYHPAHVSRLLRQIGWSSQKPITRATQRDEAAITAWRTERWPALKKGPKRKDARLSG